MSNSFPSLLFSHFIFMLCNFWFRYCSLILDIMQIVVYFPTCCLFRCFWVYWLILSISIWLLPCENTDQILACLGFWVMSWKVKSEIRILEIDLVVCSLEKVTATEKPLIWQSRANRPELNQKPLRNCDWLDLGISLYLEKGLWYLGCGFWNNL